MVIPRIRDTLNIINAGRPPLFHFQKHDKNVSEWNPTGIAFGLSEKTYYIAETIPFSSGDVFLFITDGLSEAVNGQYEEFGTDRIKSSLRIAADEQSPDKIYSRIMKDVDNFSGSQTIRDDMSILVLKIV